MDPDDQISDSDLPANFDIQSEQDTEKHKTSSVQISDEEGFAGSMTNESMDIDSAMQSVGGLNDDERIHEVFASEITAGRTDAKK